MSDFEQASAMRAAWVEARATEYITDYGMAPFDASLRAARDYERERPHRKEKSA